MADEKILSEALASPDFKVSIHDKKRTDGLETEAAEENLKQFGQNSDPAPDSKTKSEDTKTLASLWQAMSAEHRQKVVQSLKESGLGDPLNKSKLIQNAFTVDQAIREQASS